MKITKTINEVIMINTVAQGYLNRHKDGDNKIIASIKSLATKQISKIFDKYNEDREEIRLNNCAVNPADQTILREPNTANYRGESVAGDYKFTKEGQIKASQEIKALLASTVELDSRIATGTEDLIAEMTDQEREIFSGVLIPVQLEVEAEE